MKLLIDIPEHIYEHAKEMSEDSRDEGEAMRAIANGTQQESSSEIPNTCGDAISRQSAIFLASDLKQDLPDDERIADMVMAHNEGILEYQTQLSLLPSVTPQQRTGRWIPVSERLPEVGSEVLVCFDFKGKRSVYISEFYGDGEFHGFDDEYLTPEGRKCRKAVAWMPLPEPYRAESEV